MTGTIFDIKEFSIHDGPGGRIKVFLKGCPLRCVWCHNPEGLTTAPQLMHKQNLCCDCGLCQRGCDHPECRGLARCIHACPNGAVSLSGRTVTVEALADRLLADRDFLELNGGGVTVSGGEPLMHADFVCALAERLGDLHKAIQTSGYATEDTYRRVIDRFDYVMQDIKLADPALHKQYTGVDNAPILRNIDYLKRSGKAFVFRVPLIPGITDTEENLRGIARIAGDHPVELLKYNEMAGAKYAMLGMTYTLPDSANRAEDFTRFFKNATMA